MIYNIRLEYEDIPVEQGGEENVNVHIRRD